MSNNHLSSAEIKLITGRAEKSIKELHELQRKCDLNVCSSLTKSIASEVDAKLNMFSKINKTNSLPISVVEIDDLFAQLNTFPRSKRTNSMNRKVKSNLITRHQCKGSHSDLRHINETQISSASSLTDVRTIAESENNKSNDIEALIANFSKLKELNIVNFDELEKVSKKDLNNFKENLSKLDEFLKIVETKYPKNDDIVRIKENPRAEKMIELINQVKGLFSLYNLEINYNFLLISSHLWILKL